MWSPHHNTSILVSRIRVHRCMEGKLIKASPHSSQSVLATWIRSIGKFSQMGIEQLQRQKEHISEIWVHANMAWIYLLLHLYRSFVLLVDPRYLQGQCQQQPGRDRQFPFAGVVYKYGIDSKWCAVLSREVIFRVPTWWRDSLSRVAEYSINSNSMKRLATSGGWWSTILGVWVIYDRRADRGTKNSIGYRRSGWTHQRRCNSHPVPFFFTTAWMSTASPVILGSDLMNDTNYRWEEKNRPEFLCTCVLLVTAEINLGPGLLRPGLNLSIYYNELNGSCGSLGSCRPRVSTD